MLNERTGKDTSEHEDGEINDLKSLLTAIPNQGVLGPYEKMPIFFRFSPRLAITTFFEGFFVLLTYVAIVI